MYFSLNISYYLALQCVYKGSDYHANDSQTASYGFSIALAGTVEKYLHALTDSLLLYRAQRYDLRGKQLLNSNAKYYAAR